MSPAVVVEKEPVPAAEKSAPKAVAAAASKAEKRKVPPTEAAPSVAAKKAVPQTVTPPAATEPAKQVAIFCCAHIRCFLLQYTLYVPYSEQPATRIHSIAQEA
jgi:hypothetical protein